MDARRTRKKLLLAALFSFAGLACPASLRAQFVGYTSPQTVQVTLASSVACTGLPQNFVTGSVAGFSNLGQTQHYITLTPSAAAIRVTAEIDGIDNNGNAFRISDVLVSTLGNVPLSVSGSGYFPKIQVTVTCGSSAGTFTLSYSGTSSTSTPMVGSYLLGAIDKSVSAFAPANASLETRFQPPFADSEGTLVFFYQATGPLGSTVQVTCAANTANISSQTFTPSITTGLQILPVPRGSCPLMIIDYNSGGASATTYSLEYIFSVPGKQLSPGGQPLAQSNTEQTSAVNAAVSKTISVTGNARAHLFSLSARCSAGTAQLTVIDGATQIWSTAATEVGTATFRFQWNPGLAASFGSNMVITLSSCGAANTGVLDVQSSQF